MRLTIVGSGYVGLVSGTCLSNTGNQVTCLDLDPHRVKTLREGCCPIHEPGLEELLKANIASERLQFTDDPGEAYRDAQIIFICVGTPTGDDGTTDLSAVMSVADDIADAIAAALTAPHPLVVVKSTVPLGTTIAVRDRIKANVDAPFSVADNPEFLKEGDAVSDFQKPDRIVCGVDDDTGRKVLEELYAPYVRQGNPCLFMDIVSAEMVKYASNAMLACRISFMNEVSRLCDHHGADIAQVREGMCTDTRIGRDFLYAGLGYGGSCFPKDIIALIEMGREAGLPTPLNEAVHVVNQSQRLWFIERMRAVLGTDMNGLRIGVWGLAFKPRTDDIREAPSRMIVNALLESGAEVIGYDPVAADNFQRLDTGMERAEDMYEAACNVDALVICTEWSEFRTPEFDRLRSSMRSPLIFDGRNLWDPVRMAGLGFNYLCIGRPNLDPAISPADTPA